MASENGSKIVVSVPQKRLFKSGSLLETIATLPMKSESPCSMVKMDSKLPIRKDLIATDSLSNSNSKLALSDNNNGDVFGVYTNYSVTLTEGMDPSIDLYNNGMNCEHVWPQSMYEIISANHMKSDMHHLRPCKENVHGVP